MGATTPAFLKPSFHHHHHLISSSFAPRTPCGSCSEYASGLPGPFLSGWIRPGAACRADGLLLSVDVIPNALASVIGLGLCKLILKLAPCKVPLKLFNADKALMLILLTLGSNEFLFRIARYV